MSDLANKTALERITAKNASFAVIPGLGSLFAIPLRCLQSHLHLILARSTFILTYSWPKNVLFAVLTVFVFKPLQITYFGHMVSQAINDKRPLPLDQVAVVLPFHFITFKLGMSYRERDTD